MREQNLKVMMSAMAPLLDNLSSSVSQFVEALVKPGSLDAETPLRLEALYRVADAQSSGRYNHSIGVFVGALIDAVRAENQPVVDVLTKVLSRRDLPAPDPDQIAYAQDRVVRAIGMMDDDMALDFLLKIERIVPIGYQDVAVGHSLLEEVATNGSLRTFAYLTTRLPRETLTSFVMPGRVKADFVEAYVDALTEVEFRERFQRFVAEHDKPFPSPEACVLLRRACESWAPGENPALDAFYAGLRPMARHAHHRLDGFHPPAMLAAMRAYGDLASEEAFVLAREHVGNFRKGELAELLDAGLPTSLACSEFDQTWLLEDAVGDDFLTLLERLDDKEAFVSQRAARMLSWVRAGYRTDVETKVAQFTRLPALLAAGVNFDQEVVCYDRRVPAYEGSLAYEYENGRGTLFAALVALGAVPPERVMDGMTALHYCAANDDAEGIHQCAARGVPLEATVDGKARRSNQYHKEHTALALAVREGNWQAAGALLSAGADPHVKLNTGASLAQMGAKNEDFKRALKAAKAAFALKKEAAIEIDAPPPAMPAPKQKMLAL